MNGSIYISKKGQRFGPYDEATVNEYLENGNLNLEDPAWSDGLPDWRPLFQLLGVPPPPIQEPEENTARLVKADGAAGAMLQGSGIVLLFFAFPFGLLIGAIVFAAGSPARARACSKCRTKVEPKAAICPACHAQFVRLQKQDLSTRAAFIIAFAIVAVCIGGYFYLRHINP